jgi:hypothetical protein
LRDQYGLAERIMRCPSSHIMNRFAPTLVSFGYQWNRSHTGMMQNYDPATDTGSQFRHEDYSFVSNANNYVGTGRRPVARRTASSNIVNSVFACDQFDYETTSKGSYTCHEASTGSSVVPDYQNVSYADGSVRANIRGTSPGNYDVSVFDANPGKSGSLRVGTTLFYYWEGTTP